MGLAPRIMPSSFQDELHQVLFSVSNCARKADVKEPHTHPLNSAASSIGHAIPFRRWGLWILPWTGAQLVVKKEKEEDDEKKKRKKKHCGQLHRWLLYED
eukprot:951647-Pelagomonas_calceolata.AAC.1